MYGAGTSDRVVEALRVAFAAGCEALTSQWSTDGEYPAIRKTIGRPVIKTSIASEELPLLSVVRMRSRGTYQGKQEVLRSTFVVEYVGPLTHRDRLEDTWPMLQPVFRACVESLQGVVNGTPIFDHAGIFHVDYASISCTFNYYDTTTEGIPFFQLTFDALHTTDGLEQWHAVRDLPFLRELFARYIDGRPANEQPGLQTLTRTEIGEMGVVASGDDLDDDSPENENP